MHNLLQTHWYKYGDAEQKAISDPITLLCMQLRTLFIDEKRNISSLRVLSNKTWREYGKGRADSSSQHLKLWPVQAAMPASN